MTTGNPLSVASETITFVDVDVNKTDTWILVAPSVCVQFYHIAPTTLNKVVNIILCLDRFCHIIADFII